MKHIDFKPQMYHRFKCVGPACSDSCCTHWHIFVDQPTYEFMIYKSKLKDRAPEAFIRTPHGSDYAEIKLNDQQKCHLLDDKGWCLVHKMDGLEHLSDTCRLYPRKALPRGPKVTEHVLMLSCPEVVRMLLHDPDVLDFQRPEVPEPATQEPTQYRRPIAYQEQKIWMYNVMQHEHWSIEQKLFVLSDGLRRLTPYVAHPENFVLRLQAMCQENYQAVQVETYEKFQPDVAAQSYLYLHCIELLQSEHFASVMKKSPRLQKLLLQVVNILQQSKRPLDAVRASFLNPQPAYQNLLHQTPWFWSHYVRYRMYIDDVPSVTSGQFFYYMLFEFFYLKTTLLVLASSGVLSDEDIIGTVQSFHKSISGRTFVRLVDLLERDFKAIKKQAIKPMQLL